MKRYLLLFAVLVAAGCTTFPQEPPTGVPAQVGAPEIRAGDAWSYAMHDGYTKMAKGPVEFRVESVQSDNVTVRLQSGGHESTQTYTRDWNWRERPMTNLQNFRYDPAYPALPFPLSAGKTWTTYVKATDPVTGQTQRVRIDGKVMGWERVKVPAGEFDALVVRRLVYAGNADTFRSEEQIAEVDWYAPKVGGIVKQSSASSYFDKRIGCDERGCNGVIRNDWNVVELTGHRQGGR